MRNRNVKRGGGGSKIIAVLILIGLIAVAGYVYTAPEFEREVPTIHSEQNLFWNRKDPFTVQLRDNEGLKSFELILSDGTNSLIVGQGVFEEKTREQILQLKYPTSKVLDPKAKKLKLKVSVVDRSLWNMGQGNKSEKIIDINVDYQRPNVNVVADSLVAPTGIQDGLYDA